MNKHTICTMQISRILHSEDAMPGSLWKFDCRPREDTVATIRADCGLPWQVEKGSILAAGSVLTPKKVVPTGQVWAGNPAKFLRELDEDEASFILQSANNYAALAAVHSAENSKSFEEIQVQAL